MTQARQIAPDVVRHRHVGSERGRHRRVPAGNSLRTAVLPPPGPIRSLATVNLTRTLGTGLLLSSTVLYFTRVVGLSPGRVGFGFSCAGVAALCTSLPAGKLADRFGPRSVAIAFSTLYGLTVCAYALVGGFASYVVAISLGRAMLIGAGVGASALVAQVIPPEQRVQCRAYMRVVSNAGLSVGVALGGVGLHVNSRTAYQVMFVVAGLGLCASGLFYLRLTPIAAPPGPKSGRRLPVLRDRTYVSVTLLCAVLISYNTVMVVALPLWISAETTAPTWVYSALVLLNTSMVILLQVRVSKSVDSTSAGARTLFRAGLALAACCALWGVSGDRAGWLTVVLLVTGMVALTVGELQYSAAAWSLSYDLAPDHLHGEYQGMFATGVQLSDVVAPLLVGAVLSSGGEWGWLAAGAAFALAGAAVPVVVKRAPPAPAPVEPAMPVLASARA